ncbi:prepilin-type N-terminal cleavage/methylation domain-containing protein [Paraglaciecola sp. 2405UD69-4]|uniref:prepilin-type N-terminal cleavage/methylation domain-containing protein n=1 Tax=Paraglaciecola sp. 2405UD69-4 TaxID=3391836 RepID=UPI0039C8D414
MINLNAKGFTLIELIVVIIILGILSVIAAPKFIDLSTDAKLASLEALSASADSAATLVYAKALIQGEVTNAEGNVDIDGDGIDDIETVYGYPSANRTTGLANVLELGEDWAYGDTFGGGQLFISPSQIVGFSGITNNNIPLRSPNCYFTYTPPSSLGDVPTYSFITTGC